VDRTRSTRPILHASVSERATDATSGAVHADLLDRWLVSRMDRTRRAYQGDIAAFARFRDREPADAIADLMAAGPLHARQVLLEYVIDLRRRKSAPATISRRLSTLRTFARVALEAGLVGWELEPPDEGEVARAMDQLALGGVPYLIPRHPGEVDRLDLQHYAFREALGTNHLAPIGRPRSILDAGAGTGQWGFDLCEEFPEAQVVGLDLVPGKPRHPPGYRAVRANLLAGLPFVDDAFDFVHQRLLFLAVPDDAWPALVTDLVRVTRPGGWIELVEPPLMAFDPRGPAISRLTDLALAAVRRRGLDTRSTVYQSLDGWLRNAGAVDVTRREITLPVGEWGGRVGSLMATDFRVAFNAIGQALEAAGALAPGEVADLLHRVQRECAELEVRTRLAIAYGRKPG
jgi:SAM-dependent methyltransferase